MDGVHVEPRHRVLEGVARVRALLRRDAEPTVPLDCAALDARERGEERPPAPERLDQPLRWRRPRMIFVNSMSDLFHELVPLAFIEEVFSVMEQARWHTFQVLTKRAERLAELTPTLDWPANVWMGVSVENNRWAHRADYLREVPAAVRFVSAEPLLGPVDQLDLSGIDWLIAGGESGPHHRPSSGGRPSDASRRRASGAEGLLPHALHRLGRNSDEGSSGLRSATTFGSGDAEPRVA